MNDIRKLSPSELSQMMNGMNPQRATRFYNKCMTNPNTPTENIALLRQYRDQNPDRFLSEDQMRGNRGQKGSWNFERGFSGGYRNRSNGRVFDSDGFSYDQYGNRYDNNGNMTGGYNDGGSEASQGNGRANGFSRYYGAANQKPRRGYRKPVSEARSYEELGQTLMSFDSDVARTRYFMKVANNPKTPKANKEAVILYVLNHLDRFTPLADMTDDPEHNAWASKRNGNARHGFMREFRRKYL